MKQFFGRRTLFLFSSISVLLMGLVAGAFGQGDATSASSPFPTSIDKADTAWMVLATALVLFMTPGLALFYGGMVRRKNVLSTFLHSFIMMGVVSITWLLVGFSMAFDKSANGLVGGFHYAMGHVSMINPYVVSVAADGKATTHTFPIALFMLYQMMFAIITPALISGALAERMKFSGYLLFTTLWSLFVYAPIACWVWNADGWLAKLGALDFAGGTVVHLASAMAALAAAIMLGKRKSLVAKEAILPNNLPLTLLGGGLLWFGWIGFNAGSALALNGVAIGAFAATHLAAAAGMIGWMVTEKFRIGKGTALGAASGLVAGLVAITPASGYVEPIPAVFIGLIAGVVCALAVNLKTIFGFDDALDVVGVHGVGGFLGAMLTGVFASVAANKDAVEPALKDGRGALILHQFIGAASIGIFSLVVSFIILAITKAVVGLRASAQDEDEGLDEALHGEAAYNL
jgi:Amt family ammonium transporter